MSWHSQILAMALCTMYSQVKEIIIAKTQVAINLNFLLIYDSKLVTFIQRCKMVELDGNEKNSRQP